MARNAWNVPDPNNIIQEGSEARSLVSSHKSLARLPGLAEALDELVRVGYAQLHSTSAKSNGPNPVGAMDDRRSDQMGHNGVGERGERGLA